MRKFITLLLLFPALISAELNISLNKMEPPKVSLAYSKESPAAGDTLFINVRVPDNWHINANTVLDNDLIPSRVETLGEMEFFSPVWAEAIRQHNEILETDLLIFKGNFEVKLPIKSISPHFNPENITVRFHYQACSNICLPPSYVDATFQRLQKKNSEVIPAKEPSNSHNILLYTLFAFLGGLVLNVMPCVLPVLFLKIFDLLKRSKNSRKDLLKWGLSTSLGIWSSLALLALVILTVRETGMFVGWGFQFQYPIYTAAITLLVTLFALNLWGVFEIWLPGRAVHSLNMYSKREGFAGAFMHGALIVILATPCSAPFLGSAVGFAFGSGSAEIIFIFAGVALGLSFPYITLGIFPKWINKMPKPGAWMEVLKRALGFPLLLAVIWLLWVFYKQSAEEALFGLILLLALAAFFAWLSGIMANPGKPWLRFLTLWALAIVIVFCAWEFAVSPLVKQEKPKETLAASEWLPYSQHALDSLQKLNITVWINGTAEWCINCKVNEKTVHSDEHIKRFLKEKNIVRMRADCTLPNSEANALFIRFGRSAVPFDMLLMPSGEHIVFPEILTVDAVLKTFLFNNIN